MPKTTNVRMVNGDRIRQLRQSIDGLTQHKLGILVGMNGSEITKLESYQNNNPQICTLIRLAEFFKVSVTELILKDENCCS